MLHMATGPSLAHVCSELTKVISPNVLLLDFLKHSSNTHARARAHGALTECLSGEASSLRQQLADICSSESDRLSSRLTTMTREDENGRTPSFGVRRRPLQEDTEEHPVCARDSIWTPRLDSSVSPMSGPDLTFCSDSQSRCTDSDSVLNGSIHLRHERSLANCRNWFLLEHWARVLPEFYCFPDVPLGFGPEMKYF